MRNEECGTYLHDGQSVKAEWNYKRIVMPGKVAGNNNKGQPMKDITCVIWCVVALVYYLCRGGEYESSRCE